MIHTEQDVVVQLVQPYLESIGFTVSTLDFETSFNLKLGRFWYQKRSATGAEKAVVHATARLDILCKDGDRNLLVIEVKRNQHELTKSDHLQAVSYARLVHPIAPIAAVTNGSVWHFIDTISQERIDPAGAANLAGTDVTLPPDLYEEALAQLMAFSSDMVQAFCRLQRQATQRPLRTPIAGSRAVYDPATYVPPEGLLDGVMEWSEQKGTYLVVTGSSGVGKSCFTCFASEKLEAVGVAVMAYRAVDLERNLLESIADDIEFGHSSTGSSSSSLRRALKAISGRRLVVIIDGLDETDASRAHSIIAAWERRVSTTHSIGLLITCKESRWKRMLSDSGVPSHLAVKLEDGTANRVISIDTPLPYRQFNAIIAKYREAYSCTLRIEPSLGEACRQNLRLLRLVFELAEANGWSVITADLAGLYEAYFDFVLSYLGDSRDSGLQLLRRIGQAVYETGREQVYADDFNGDSVLLAESAIRRLESAGVLRVRRTKTTTGYAFAYDGFRDYVVAFIALELDKKSREPLRDFFEKTTHELQRLILLGYYQLSTAANIRAFDSEAFELTTGLIAAVQEEIRNNFPTAARVTGGAKGEALGVIGLFRSDTTKLTSYGYRAIGRGDADVLLYPGTMWSNVTERAAMRGASRFAWDSKLDAGTTEPAWLRARAWSDLIDLYLRAIKTGELVEDTSPALLNERAMLMAKQLQLKIPPRNALKGPWQISVLNSEIQTLQWIRQLDAGLLDKKLRAGQASERWNGQYQSISWEVSQDEQEMLAAEAVRLQALHCAGPPNRPGIKRDEAALIASIQALQSAGVLEVRVPPWFPLQPLPTQDRGLLVLAPEIDRARSILPELHRELLRSYRKVIEANFGPGFRQGLEFYASLPIHRFLLLDHDGSLCVYDCETHEGESTVTLVESKDEFVADVQSRELRYRGTKHRFRRLSRSLGGGLISRNKCYMPAWCTQRGGWLRTLLYDQLVADIEALQKQKRAGAGQE